jgi:hypothetical protein
VKVYVVSVSIFTTASDDQSKKAKTLVTSPLVNEMMNEN